MSENQKELFEKLFVEFKEKSDIFLDSEEEDYFKTRDEYFQKAEEFYASYINLKYGPLALNLNLDAQSLKDVKRFSTVNSIFHESVAEHVFGVIFLAQTLMKTYLLNLDFEKVIYMCLLHDFGEIGLENDFTVDAQADLKIKQIKEKYEQQIIEQLDEKHNQYSIIETIKEYEEQKTSEAKFVNAVDKLESAIHIIKQNCTKSLDIENHTIPRLKKAISNFPQLQPMYESVKAKLLQLSKKERAFKKNCTLDKYVLSK